MNTVSTSIDNKNRIIPPELNVPPRLLLGPGPSNANPRVLQALAMSPVGHLDPYFLQLMDEVQTLLRYAWQTDNPMTIPMSGTGSAAMEATLANIVETRGRGFSGGDGVFWPSFGGHGRPLSGRCAKISETLGPGF
ncbi:MAG: hypothetical protein RSE13_12745 [Planktothrix sp. GU0601_MAG3]|nr:MAG: hypothetical protein RSE13_12745 [Planktothrix sp. GU0601_MAG3]